MTVELVIRTGLIRGLPSCRRGQWGILSWCLRNQPRCYCWWALHTSSWCRGSIPPPEDTILDFRTEAIITTLYRKQALFIRTTWTIIQLLLGVSIICIDITWTPKTSSLSCRFRRAHSDCCPCSRFVHMAISPQVISAPKRLHTRRKGRFPHWEREGII